MEISSLRSELDKIDTIPGNEWIKSLDERKKKELSFHDQLRDSSLVETLSDEEKEKIYGNKKYYSMDEDYDQDSPYAQINHKLEALIYVNRWIENNVADKVFLDYCCGDGEKAILAAKSGASLAIGVDISGHSVLTARKKAIEEGVEKNTYFVQGDAEDTKLPGESIDRIICTGVLHHLDVSYAFPELRRVLAPEGKIICLEALDYNPAIKWYRKRTPEMRTVWEMNHILSLKEIGFAKWFFDVKDIRYWHISSILGPHLKFMIPFFQVLDRILTRVPLIRLMAWIFTFELHKKGVE